VSGIELRIHTLICDTHSGQEMGIREGNRETVDGTCGAGSDMTDPKKLIVLAAEIVRLLEEKRARLDKIMPRSRPDEPKLKPRAFKGRGRGTGVCFTNQSPGAFP